MVPLVLTMGKNVRLYWNLSQNVGLNCPNVREDVHLVQFAYSIMATNPKSTSPAKPIFAAVKVGAECTGREGDPLIAAIRADQKIRGGTQDGRVSVIKGTDEVYGTSHAFLMIFLNNNLFDAVPNDFPRLDKHPKCPPLVRDAIKRSCDRG